MRMSAAACSAPGGRSQHRVWRTHPGTAAGTVCAMREYRRRSGVANPLGPVDQRRKAAKAGPSGCLGTPFDGVLAARCDAVASLVGLSSAPGVALDWVIVECFRRL